MTYSNHSLFLKEAPIIDPVTLKPDLYAAAAANDLEKVVSLLEEAVPATFIELKTGWTVRQIKSYIYCPFTYAYVFVYVFPPILAASLGRNAW